jgi:hypothetical protein
MTIELPEHFPVDIQSIDIDPRAEADEDPELVVTRICWRCMTDWPCEVAALAEVPD